MAGQLLAAQLIPSLQMICFRLIKVVKDRIRTVHQEDRLQNLIVCVAAVVDSAAAADSDDFSPNFKCV